jgi:hypothetical protein
MGLRPAIMHENRLFDVKPFISNNGFGYLHGRGFWLDARIIASPDFLRYS